MNYDWRCEWCGSRYCYGDCCCSPRQRYKPAPTRNEVLRSHAQVHIARFQSGAITSVELARLLQRDADLYDHKKAR